MDILAYISHIFILAGAFFIFSGALGVIRFPDFYTRLHPAGVNDTVGLGFILTGIAIETGLTLDSLKIIILLLFSWVTSATACHALAKAALVSGLKPKARLVKGKAPSKNKSKQA